MTATSKIFNELSSFQKFRINFRCHVRRFSMNWVCQLLSALVMTTALTHASVYLVYGPEHPRCMQQWKEMKQRGKLKDELLWKERLLLTRRREFFSALDGYGEVDKWKHPRATLAATSASPRALL